MAACDASEFTKPICRIALSVFLCGFASLRLCVLAGEDISRKVAKTAEESEEALSRRLR